MFNPVKEGGAGSDETKSTNFREGVFGSKENSFACSSHGSISEAATVLVDNTLNFTSSEFAG